ncbi:MAG: hypothetical protein HGN29_06710 [Asgard group archaeon]|nr:hypothetical protein [Asgard group archaeon]
MNNKDDIKEKDITSFSLFSFLKIFKNKRRNKIALMSLLLIILLSISTFSVIFIIKKNKSVASFSREYLLENVEMSRFQAVVEYIISCFDKESGGFMRKPIREVLDGNSAVENPDIWSTWFGFGTLLKLNEITKINTTILLNWIESEVNENSDYYGSKDLLGIFKTLSFLDESERISKIKWINMIMNNYIEEGGFRSHKDGLAPASSTYFAYVLLKELNELSQVNWSKATDYLLSWQTSSGYFSHPLMPGGENIGETVYAYSYLNISNQVHLINKTRLNEIITESFDWNYYSAFRISIAYVLMDFTRINGNSYHSQFINNEDMILEIKQSQQELYGNFPFEWKDEIHGDIYDTCKAIMIFSENNKLDILNENITVKHPPLSPYTEINETWSNFSAALFSQIIGSLVVIFLYKRKKR